MAVRLMTVQPMAVRPSSVFVALADCQTDVTDTTNATNTHDALVPFYRKLFGLDPTVHLPHYAEFQLPGLRLGIFSPQADRQAEFAGRSGGFSLCIEVSSLEAAIAHLTEIGYPPTTAIMTASHGREIYVYDPAGNRLILHQAS